jgi:hypothetical protein
MVSCSLFHLEVFQGLLHVLRRRQLNQVTGHQRVLVFEVLDEPVDKTAFKKISLIQTFGVLIMVLHLVFLEL